MTEHLDTIPDDLPTCQELLRGALKQLHELERQLHDLEYQLDQTCATTEELQRSYACLKEEYLALKRLCPESVGGTAPVRERWPVGDRQQFLGADVATVRGRSEELDVFWERSGRGDRSHLHEYPRQRQAARDRAVRVCPPVVDCSVIG